MRQANPGEIQKSQGIEDERYATINVQLFPREMERSSGTTIWW